MIGIGIRLGPRRYSVTADLLRTIPTLSNLIFPEDSPDDVSLLRARIGSDANPAAAARATRSSALGIPSWVFSGVASLCGYNAAPGNKTVFAVARFSGTLPFTQYTGLVGGGSPALYAAPGTSDMSTGIGTIYRDGVATRAVDLEPHLWVSVTTVASGTPQVGSNAVAARNWQGDIWCFGQCAGSLTAPQVTELGRILRRKYRFLP